MTRSPPVEFGGLKSLSHRAVLPVFFVGMGFVGGACEEGQTPTAMAPTPPPVAPAPPPEPEPPAVTVSFVDESKQVVEGETTEILVALSGAVVSRLLRIQVAVEQETVVDTDYELLTPVLEIPASGMSDRTTTITFKALEDIDFAEGDETLWLSLRAPDQSDIAFGPRLAVTINDAGVSPCDGIRVRVEPPTQTPSHGAVRTQLTIVSDMRSGAVAADWLGPYQDYQGQALGRRIQNQFNLVVEDWSLRVEGATSHQKITIWWNPEEEFGLRFRSSNDACSNEPVLTCTGAACELRR